MIWKQFTHLGNFPPELKARFNSFLTTEFDDSLSVEMQLRSIIKWCQDNFKTVDTLIDFINELSNWLKQFENNFDTKLEDSVISVLSEWQASGKLDVVISEALQWQLDDYIATNEQDKDSLTAQLQQTNVRLNQIKLNVSDYGALGDGSTDDTIPIQTALDDLVEQGGGTLYFPSGTYLVTKPLLMKSNAVTGGYDYPAYKMEGQSNNGTIILKENETKYNDIDAAVIMIHASLDLNKSTTSHQFENITITNNSEGEHTYGVYSNKSSRTIVKHSSFKTKKQYATLATHNRYAFYMTSTWSSTFTDSTFHGDYGLFIEGNSTSLLLENLYSSCDKIGYRLSGIYSTINNCFGDYGRGTLFEFYHARYAISSIAGEANDASVMMRFTNSIVSIDSAYFHKSHLDEGVVIESNSSTVNINTLVVFVNDDIARGYFIRAGLKNKITVNQLRLTGGTGKFKYHDFDTMGNNFNEYNIIKTSGDKAMKGLADVRGTKGEYWDWYMDEPQIKTNDIYFGLKKPTVLNDGTSSEWATSGYENGVYINSDFNDLKVLGWVRYAQTSSTLRDGSNHYIPLILSGSTGERPTNKIVGQQYFDTTLGKPVWYYNNGWVDTNGVTV